MRNTLSLLIFTCTVTLTTGTAVADDQAAIERGQYLAIAADCGACHTVDQTKPFAGGLKIASPVGNIYSTNITPDNQTGIGGYSLAEFSRAVREGVAKDGSMLYPAMPWPSYSGLNDADVRDLYAYFKNAVKPQVHPNRDTDIPWPLNMRWPLQLWKWAFVSHSPAKKLSTDPQWSRGAYLVQTLGHCGACHTPRGVAFQEKALDHADPDYLSGGKTGVWYAPDLTGTSGSGLAEWSQQEIVDFLDTGKNARTTAFGPMKEVITKSTHQMTDDDLNAIAVYLKSLPAARQEASSPQKTKTAMGEHNAPGAQIYADNCAACHRDNGKGYPDIFPALAGNSAILSNDPSSVISLILVGGAPPGINGAASDISMPDFAGQLTDQQIAEATSFIRNSWGNHAGPVTPKQVQSIRKKILEESAE